MALTRAMLKAMSIEDEKIDQIIDQHISTLEEIKKERDEYKKLADELPNAKQRIEELEKTSGNDDLQAELESVKNEFDQYKLNVEADKVKRQRESMYRDLLRDSGIDDKRIGSVLKVTNLDEFEYGEDGSFKDADGIKAKIVEEWGDFIPNTQKRSAVPENPPSNIVKHGMTKEEIFAIKDTAKRQQAIAENLELFN